MSKVFLKRYTEQRLNYQIETITPKDTFSDGTRIPTTFDLDEGATSVVAEVIETRGQSDYIDNWSQIPEIGMSLTEDTYPVLDQAVAFTYNFKQVKAAELAAKKGYNGSKALLSDRPMAQCVKALYQRANVFSVYGKGGIPGFFNTAGVLEEPSTFNPYTSTDPNAIRAWITEGISDIQYENRAETTDTMVDSLLLPSRIFRVMHETLIPNTKTNLVTWIKENYPFVKNIDFTNFLNSETLEEFKVQASGTNKDWMIWYKRDPLYVSRQSTKVIPFDVERAGLLYKVIFLMSNSATQVHQLDWMKRTTFPKA
jgi:hypothetical protein